MCTQDARPLPQTPQTQQAAAPADDSRRLLGASIEAKLDGERCSLRIDTPADSPLAAALLRALLPPQAAGADVVAALRALEAKGIAPEAKGIAPALSPRPLGPAGSGAQGARRFGVLRGATHFFKYGFLCPLLKDEGGGGFEFYYMDANMMKMPVSTE